MSESGTKRLLGLQVSGSTPSSILFINHALLPPYFIYSMLLIYHTFHKAQYPYTIPSTLTTDYLYLLLRVSALPSHMLSTTKTCHVREPYSLQ